MIDTLPQWTQTVGTVFTSAAGASLLFWLAKRRKTGESFKLERAAATLGAAFGLSVVLLATGMATGQEDLLAQLSLFVGPVAVFLQETYQRYQRTGDIQVSTREVEDALGVLANMIDGVPRSSTSVEFGDSGFGPDTDSQQGTPADHDAASIEDTGTGHIPASVKRNVADVPDSQTDATDEQAQVRAAIERADYGTLRQVATIVEGARGSGEGNTTERMREDLRAADSAAVASAFESVTSKRAESTQE